MSEPYIVPIAKFCPVHLGLLSGDPRRCLVCEPDQEDAEFIYKSRLNDDDLNNLTEKQSLAFHRHLGVTFMQRAVRVN